MASGQKVIGRHEVFEYTYRTGPADERKRIKLVVIQRREQRRKSLIAAARYLERTPVRLRVNLNRAQYGDPEIVSGSRHVPITLRRKVKAAPATIIRTAVSPAPQPEPARIELVDRPVGSSDSEYVDDPPPPIVVVPPSHTPSPERRPASLVRTASGSSTGGRPKVRRSNSITSGFRRFPSLMGILRRNSKSSAPPSVAPAEDNQVVISGNYFDHDAPRTPESHVIVEERESELGSPISPSAMYGPPSIAGSRYTHKPVPPVPESVNSGRSGRSRNKLIKASPHHVPLPDSLRQSDATGMGSPPITGAFPVHTRQSAEYEPARSVTSRHTGERSVHVPEYAETYLHDSPTSRSRSLHNESLKSRSIHDGASARTHNRSLHDLSLHNRSAHDLSMRTPSRHSHEASVRDGMSLHDLHSNGARSPSLGEPSVRDHSVREHSIREHSVRDPSVREHSIRDPSLREHSVRDSSVREHSIRDPSLREHSLRGGGSIRDGGLYSPTASMREVLSDGDRENDHRDYYEHGSIHSRMGSRVGSPSLHAPSRVASPPIHGGGGSYYRDGSPSIHAPSHRGASPSLHAPSHRGISPSLHAPSHRGDSPSLHAPSRVASPSYDPSTRHVSPPVSMHAPSTRSRVAESVVSSRHPGSSVNGRHGVPGGFGRPKSPLSASGSSHASSRRTHGPLGPEITPVPMTAPSVASHRTTASKNGLRSPLSRVASPPISEAPIIPPMTAPSVAGSHRSGRASELAYQTPLPPSTYAPSAISRAPSAAAITRAPSAAGSRIPTAASTISRAPSAATVTRGPPSRVPSAAGISRAPSASGISRVPSAAGISRAPSAAAISRVPSAAGHSIIRAPSAAPTAAGIPLPPSVVGAPSTYAPSAAGISRAPSAAGTRRAPSAAGISRAPSAAGTHRQAPSVSVSQRIPPSVIGSQRVPPSIAGSAPSQAPSRQTPPPEPFQPALSDIAPESESHGGQALRAQARLEGDKMAMFFQMSQQAHKEGDGARAKELSDIGRQHQVRMQELHAEAASQIFKEKNADRQQDEIDLHGLYVKEALHRLSQFIREAPLAGQTSLRVITGKGIHSDRGQAQIIPAVEESLRNKGLRHHTDETNSGVIVVELGPRSPVSE